MNRRAFFGLIVGAVIGRKLQATVPDPVSGASLRFIRKRDERTDQMCSRLDVLYGWAALRPELACRIV